MTIKESESLEMDMVAMMAEMEETKRMANATVEGRVWVLYQWNSDAGNSWLEGVFSCAQKAMDRAGVARELWTIHQKYVITAAEYFKTMEYDDFCGYRGYTIEEMNLDPAPDSASMMTIDD